MLIIARTDAVHGSEHGVDEAIDRCNEYGEAGADMVKIFPDNMNDLRRIAREVTTTRKMFVYSEGRARPRPNVAELQRLGFALVNYPSTVVVTVYKAIRDVFRDLAEHGHTNLDNDEMSELREELQGVLGFAELLSIEERYAHHFR